MIVIQLLAGFWVIGLASFGLVCIVLMWNDVQPNEFRDWLCGEIEEQDQEKVSDLFMVGERPSGEKRTDGKGPATSPIVSPR